MTRREFFRRMFSLILGPLILLVGEDGRKEEITPGKDLAG
jgi:hypothetical protein